MQSEVTTYYTVAQAAKMTGYSIPTIRNRIREIDPRLKESYVVKIDGYGGKPVTHICEHQVNLWKKERQETGPDDDNAKEYIYKEDILPGQSNPVEGVNSQSKSFNDTSIQIFDNPEFGSVRTVIVNNEPWFVGKDVAEALGYVKTQNAISVHVDDEDKTLAPIQGGCSTGTQNTTIINESGLYSLILSSKLPSAKSFKRWVTSEVLPTLRKTGNYSMAPTFNTPTNFGEACQMLANEWFKNEQLEQTLSIVQPKAEYLDTIVDDDKLITTTVIAKHFGMSCMHLNNILKDLGIQFKAGGVWCLKAKYHDLGYAKIITGTNQHGSVYQQRKWTQKGKRFIYDLLLGNGFVKTNTGVAVYGQPV